MTYPATVLANSPTHYWRCQEAGGPLLIDIGSSPYHLAMNSGFLLGSAGICGDGVAVFCGPDLLQRMFIPKVGSYVTNPFTVEFWAYPFAVETLGNTCLFSNADGTAHKGIEIFLLSTLKWQVNVGNGAAYLNIAPAAATTTYAWHHVVMTMTGTTCTLYVDGVNLGTVTVTFVADVNTGLNFNASSTPTGGTSFSRALYTECAIYPTALSGADVTSHFNAGTLRNTIPLFRAPGPGGAIVDSGGFTVDMASILEAVRKTFG
jgi:hypothetical protein